MLICKLFLFVALSLLAVASFADAGCFARAYARKADRHQRIANRHAAKANCSAACANAPAQAAPAQKSIPKK